MPSLRPNLLCAMELLVLFSAAHAVTGGVAA